MPIQEKILGQTCPATTAITALYAPLTGVTAIAKMLYVANLMSDVHSFTIYHSESSTAASSTNALLFKIEVPGRATERIPMWMALNDSNGLVAVESSTGSAFAFTLYGGERTT